VVTETTFAIRDDAIDSIAEKQFGSAIVEVAGVWQCCQMLLRVDISGGDRTGFGARGRKMMKLQKLLCLKAVWAI